MESNEELLRNLGQRICKRDNSLKLQFKVRHFFIGGYELKLVPTSPISIQVNSSGKTSLRFLIDDDNTFGLKKQDIGLCLTQFESIVITTDENELPPMLACYMLPGCFEKMCGVQPGLRNVLKEQLKYNNNIGIFKVLIFVLKPWKDSAYYMRAEFKDQDKVVEQPVELDDAVNLMKKELGAVWDLMRQEKLKEKKIGKKSHKNHANPSKKTVNIVNHEQFNRILSELKISKMPIKKDGMVKFIDAKKGGVQNFSNGGYRTIEPSGKKDVPGAKRARWDLKPENQMFVTRDEVWVRRIRLSQEKKQSGIQIPSQEDVYDHQFQRALQNHNSRNWPHDYQSLNNGYQSNSEGNNVDNLTNQMRNLGHTNYVDNHAYYQHPNVQQFASVDAVVTNGLGGFHISQPPASLIATVSSQGDVAANQHKPTIRERKRAGPGIENQALPERREPRATGDEPLVVLPPSRFGGETITLIIRDIKTLDRKEFVNDNVMTFMMHYISSHQIKNELILKIHMFNTFFYNSLGKDITPLGFSGRVQRNANDSPNLITNVKRMERWTRKFDLFAKDYIVFPINEDLHWMVVAVINIQGALIETGNEEASRNAPKCYMVFYDPLSGLDGTRRHHICHMLKEYLAVMCRQTKAANMKYAVNKGATLDKDRIIVVRPKNAPIQNNFSDCGLYALHFIEGLFCNVDRPVTVDDFPDFDWKKFWPEADNMCDFMRDKVYNLLKNRAAPRVRSRIEQYERDNRCGLSREGDSRKSRRHSAVPFRRPPRNTNYYRRCYSLNPPASRVVQDDPLFTNPRHLATMPITQKVRGIKPPEPNFPITY